MIFPRAAWEEGSPESQGMDSAKLRRAVAYLAEHSGADGAKELVIVRNGYLVWQGPNANAYHNVFSCTKVFTSTVLGLLVDDGQCTVDDLAIKHLPGLDDEHALYSRIKLRHIASMSGGYLGIVRDKGPESPWGEPMAYLTPMPPRYEAGTACAYHDHDVFLLGSILTRLAGRPLKDLFQRGIAGPIGMTKWDWGVSGRLDNGIALNNAAGTPSASPGIQITALDFARLGHLYLNRGAWGRRQLLSASFVMQATTNQVPVSLRHASGADPAGRYGFYWWTNGVMRNGERPWPSAPPSTYAARGASANYCFVVPEWDMVIVRLGSSAQESKVSDQVWDAFLAGLGDAIGAGLAATTAS